MPTQLFQQLPWQGGINTSLDESMIPANQLTVADNVVFDTRGSRKKRDGIKHNWDSATTGTASVIAQQDYWFGNGLSRTQRHVAILSDGTINSYTSSGTKTALTVSGTAWSGTLTSASFLTFGNILIVAVSGSTNVMKYWTGDVSVPFQDVYNDYMNNTLTRASAGTTRTIKFNEAFGGANGSIVNVALSGDGANYNGTFTVASVTTTTVTNDTITYVASGALTEAATSDTTLRVGSNNVPKASILRENYGRVLCNDKSNPDNLLYSPTGDWTRWNGYGDSGGFPIVQGDGDPVGINAIFPTFKGVLFVAKKTKLYRIDGTSPEDFQVTKVSDGIGCVSHNSITAIDQDDVFFASEKGVHSLNATQAFGDFDSTYVSIDIQKTFNGLNKSRLQYIFGAYLDNLNSVAFTFSSAGSTSNDLLYLYNIPTKAWYRWTTPVAYQSIAVSNDTDKKRFYLGTATGRISKTLNGTNYDISVAGVNTAISFHITTGVIYPDSNQYTQKAFKRFILFYKPQNTYTISTTVQIDNLTINSENSLNFSDTSGLDLVGSTFVVGTSVVGYDVPLGAYVRQIDGYGRGCKIDIITSGVDEPVEIQGFAIEWEAAGVSYLTYSA